MKIIKTFACGALILLVANTISDKVRTKFG